MTEIAGVSVKKEEHGIVRAGFEPPTPPTVETGPVSRGEEMVIDDATGATSRSLRVPQPVRVSGWKEDQGSLEQSHEQDHGSEDSDCDGESSHRHLERAPSSLIRREAPRGQLKGVPDVAGE
jgi:hypothetical protein